METRWRIAYADSATYHDRYGFDNRNRNTETPRAIIQYTQGGTLVWNDHAGEQHLTKGHFVLFTANEASSFHRLPIPAPTDVAGSA